MVKISGSQVLLQHDSGQHDNNTNEGGALVDVTAHIAFAKFCGVWHSSELLRKLFFVSNRCLRRLFKIGD